MSDLQIRRRPATRVEPIDDDEGIVKAYVSVYDVEYRIGPFGIREKIKAGAFDKSIEAKGVVPHFWSHNWPFGLMVGDSTMSSDEKGLIASAELDMDDELGRRVFRRHKSGAIDEFSIGYIPTLVEIDPDDEDLEIIVEAQLIETSSVVLGANPETELIEVRARDAGTHGGLKAPVLAPDSNGVLRVSWVPAENAEPAEPTTEKPSKEPSKEQPVSVTGSIPEGQFHVNVTVNTGAPATSAGAVENETAYALLREPAFREHVRKNFV